MRILQLSLFFGLAQVILCQGYDDLVKDECFRKAYICGDHRVSITGGTGRLVTEPHRFGEVCRRHKEFIACIEDASKFCVDKMTNLSRMVLDNRKSVKMFCTDIEWRKSYFASAKCINENEQKVMDECRKEESEYVDDRPWWCLIPEPCEALQRVFDCSVQKMSKLCGSTAAEVYRRIQILKVENRDVVCEFRRRNPLYCRYQRTERTQRTQRHKRDLASDSKDNVLYRLIGDLPSSVAEVLNDAVRTAIINTISKLRRHKEDFSDTLESDDLKIRKLLVKTVDSEEKKEATQLKQSKFHGVNLYLDVAEMEHLQDFIKREQLQFIKDSEMFEDLQTKMKEYIVRLIDILKLSKNIAVGRFGEDFIETYWKELENFPVQSMVCEWENKMFKCILKLERSNLETLSPQSLIKNQDNIQPVDEDSINYSDLLSSLMERVKEETSPKVEEIETEETDTVVTPESRGFLDIHRIGYLNESPEISENNPSDLTSNSERSEVNTDSSADLEDLNTAQTGYVLIDGPYYPTVAEAYIVDMDPTTESYFQSKPDNLDLDSREADNSKEVEERSESFQLREIEDAIEERFKSINTDSIKFQTESEKENHCSAEQFADNAEECGNRGSIFTSSTDTPVKEDSSTEDTPSTISPDINSVTTVDELYEAIDQFVKGAYKRFAPEVTTECHPKDLDSDSTSSYDSSNKKIQLTGSLRQFKREATTTEDPFYESIQRLATEEHARRARAEELESFIKEKNEMIERERKAFSEGFAGSKSSPKEHKDEL